MELKENLSDYTVKGMNFEAGFFNLIYELENASCNYTIYLDTENENIDTMPTCYYNGQPETYYGDYIELMEWKQSSGWTRLEEYYTSGELLEAVTEDEQKELEQDFINLYNEEYDEEDADEFWELYEHEFITYLISSSDENIEKMIDNTVKEASDFYLNELYQNYQNILEEAKKWKN